MASLDDWSESDVLQMYQEIYPTSGVATGGRWWRQLPGIGRTKAQRIAAHLSMRLSEQPPPKLRPVFVLPQTALDSVSLVPATSELTMNLPADKRQKACLNCAWQPWKTMKSFRHQKIELFIQKLR